MPMGTEAIRRCISWIGSPKKTANSAIRKVQYANSIFLIASNFFFFFISELKKIDRKISRSKIIGLVRVIGFSKLT